MTRPASILRQNSSDAAHVFYESHFVNTSLFFGPPPGENFPPR